MDDSVANDVTNNTAANRFEVSIDGHLAVAEYRIDQDTVTFTHTKVPAELAGHGVATQLIVAGLKMARERHLKVIPRCRFVAAYMLRHPEVQDLLSEAGQKLLHSSPPS